MYVKLHRPIHSSTCQQHLPSPHQADTFLSNKIVRIDPRSGELDEYDIPYTIPLLPVSSIPAFAQAQGAVGACVVRTGYDGKVYVATGVRNQLARIDPATKVVEVFNTGDPQDPTGNLQPFNDAWPGEYGVSNVPGIRARSGRQGSTVLTALLRDD